MTILNEGNALEDAQDAVVREALNSTWNAQGGDQMDDEQHGPVCAVAWCGLEQGIFSCIASFDSKDAFGKDYQMKHNDLTGRVDAMTASLRRVVDKGVKDGVLKEVQTSNRYSLGVTFVDGKEL